MGDVFIYPVGSSPYLEAGFHRAYHSLMKSMHVPLTLLAVFGCMLVWSPLWGRLGGKRATVLDPTALRFLALFVVYFLLLHIVVAPFPRCGVPLRPFIYLFSVSFMVSVAAIFLGNRSPSEPLSRVPQ